MTKQVGRLTIQAFDTITLQVADLPRSLLFYEQALGLAFSRQSPRAAETMVGEVRLLLHEDFAPSLKNGRRGAGVSLHLSVLDVDACCGELRRSGLKIRAEPANHPWGRECGVIDPDGYEVEFIGPVREPAPSSKAT